jgi:hypothetical protein
MRTNGICLATVLSAALSLSVIACKRGDSAASAQAVPNAILLTAPQTPQASPPAQVPPRQPSSNVLTPSPSVLDETYKTSVPANISAANSTESFTIAGHTFRMLKHVQRTAHEETVEWWELRNSKDQVVYRETYPVSVANGEFDSTVSVTATPFTTKEGAGIIVQRGEEPSDPMAGGSVQMFAFKYGREEYGVDESLFQSFGPPILVEGEYLGLDSDTTRPKPTLPAGITMMTMDDILKFKIWTGNFYVIYPVRINWITGSLEPGLRCMEMTSQGRTGRCLYPVAVEAHRESEPTFVRLFPEADDGATPKHIILQPDTKVEYLEARLQLDWVPQDGRSINLKVNGDVWLKVGIAGQEGWVHSEEDFQALGVPQAE